MKFRDRIIESIIEPENRSKMSAVKGQIIRYYEEDNTADVYVSTLGGVASYDILNWVPIQIPSSGLHQSPVKQGDYVYVQFNNNSIYQPQITGKCDDEYSTNTKASEKHLRKGALVVSQTEMDGELKPSCESWVEPQNTNSFKYSSYSNYNAGDIMAKKIKSRGEFKGQEVGLYNPISSSIVKVQDDGTIDIFSSTNTGVRINPNSKTVEILGNTTTKSNIWSVISNSVEISASDKVSIKAKEISFEADKITRNGVDVDV